MHPSEFLGTRKLTGFLDTDKEEMIRQLMVLKQASRSIGRMGNEKSLLEGLMVSNSDSDLTIDEVMLKLAFDRCSGHYHLASGKALFITIRRISLTSQICCPAIFSDLVWLWSAPLVRLTDPLDFLHWKVNSARRMTFQLSHHPLIKPRDSFCTLNSHGPARIPQIG